jgi:hypothetical protein
MAEVLVDLVRETAAHADHAVLRHGVAGAPA